MVLAGIITFVAGFFMCKAFGYVHLPKYIFEFTKITTVLFACGILYIILNIVFKMDYAKELFNRLKK